MMTDDMTQAPLSNKSTFGRSKMENKSHELRELVRWDDKPSRDSVISHKSSGDNTRSDARPKRENLIHLCKDRAMSEVDLKRSTKETSNTRLSETKTEASTVYSKSSWNSSPVMKSLFIDDETPISEEPVLEGSQAKVTVTLTKLTTEQEDDIKFYCKAKYKAGPKKSQLPKLSF